MRAASACCKSYMARRAIPSEGFCCRTWLCKLARPLRFAPHPNYLLRPRQISRIRCSAADACRANRDSFLMCTMRCMETPKQPFLSKGGQKRGTKFNELSLSDTNLAWLLNMERKKSLKSAAAYWKDLELLALLGNRGSATTCKLDLPATFPLLIFFTGYMDGMQWEPEWIDARRQRGDLHPFPTENRNELKRVQSKKWLHRQQSGEMEKSGVHTSSRTGAHTHHSLLHRGTNQRDTTSGKNKLFANRDAIPPLFHLSLSVA